MHVIEQVESAQVLPTGSSDLNKFSQLIREKSPFTFIRFSDGEIEILRNRRLVISGGVTEFRGKKFSNQFPEFDQKRFDPRNGQDVRRDLLTSALFNGSAYFKGIPTRHNHAIGDREFMLRLNGGFSSQMTFSDLFLNENFIRTRSEFFPFAVSCHNDLLVVGNWRCELRGYLSKGSLVKIPDNFFEIYQQTLKNVLDRLEEAPKSALVLCSASSLSNILGYRLHQSRSDLTFLDVGTVLNDLMGLPLTTRAYHKVMNPRTLGEKFAAWQYRLNNEYQLRW
jgi:hypothetical protein